MIESKARSFLLRFIFPPLVFLSKTIEFGNGWVSRPILKFRILREKHLQPFFKARCDWLGDGILINRPLLWFLGRILLGRLSLWCLVWSRQLGEISYCDLRSWGPGLVLVAHLVHSILPAHFHLSYLFAYNHTTGESSGLRGASTVPSCVSVCVWVPIFKSRHTKVRWFFSLWYMEHRVWTIKLTMQSMQVHPALEWLSCGSKIWRRSARNTPPSTASSFGKNLPVSWVYLLSSFSDLKSRIFCLDLSTRSTRLTCFLNTA